MIIGNTFRPGGTEITVLLQRAGRSARQSPPSPVLVIIRSGAASIAASPQISVG
jgi:hypothetical protein